MAESLAASTIQADFSGFSTKLSTAFVDKRHLSLDKKYLDDSLLFYFNIVSEVSKAQSSTAGILVVALPSPVANAFDYRLPVQFPLPMAGVRVRVPFGRRNLLGLVIDTKAHSEVPSEKLKNVLEVIDQEPILSPQLLTLLTRIARYYHHPLGEVIFTALPAMLREGKSLQATDVVVWVSQSEQPAEMLKALQRAPKQRAVLQILQQHSQGLPAPTLATLVNDPATALRSLAAKGLVRRDRRPCTPREISASTTTAPKLRAEQQAAVEALLHSSDAFGIHLLDGVTGSGKTEVYLAVLEQCLARGRQALVLVPEIALTPQLEQRFARRLPHRVISLHSAMSKTARLCAWQVASSGEAAVILGTRSAVFTPCKSLGVVIVDEEHDPSYKQQEGLRYHGRDVAILRAQQAQIPVILGSATPSLESLSNAAAGRYQHLRLRERAGGAHLPQIELVDLRQQQVSEGISTTLAERMRAHLAQGRQVLLFLNRRGYAPVMLCHSCGETLDCPRCDTTVTYHAHQQALRCHHCGTHFPVPASCSHCGSEALTAIGLGTQKIEAAVTQLFPDRSMIRIDRDSMTRKGALPKALEAIRRGEHQIIIGTQMLAKGHDFHNITLVGMINVDQGLFSTDFHAPERLAQQLLQVSGRAGRGEVRGEVVIQTHQPEHPLLQALLRRDYTYIAQNMLLERQQQRWPPYTHIALFRASAHQRVDATNLLEKIAVLLNHYNAQALEILGPVMAPMERRAGRYRVQLLLRSTQRDALHRALAQALPEIRRLKAARKARWSLDIDPVDMA